MTCNFIATGETHATRGAIWTCANPSAEDAAKPCAMRVYGEFPPHCSFCKGQANNPATIPDFMADMACPHLLSVATKEIPTGCCGGASTAIEFGTCDVFGACSIVGHQKTTACFRCKLRPGGSA